MPTLKALARKPAFTLGVVGMFALGIAASTAIFSIFNGLFLASLPYPAADRLVFLSEIALRRNLRQIRVSFLDLENWRSSTQAFDHVAGFHDAGGYNLSGAEGPVRVHGALVTSDMGATLGIKPILGRDFVPGDDRQDAGHIVLLGYRIWMREFGGRADVVGKIVRLDARPYTVIGVLPRNAVFPEDDFWTPQAPVIWDRARILNGPCSCHQQPFGTNGMCC